MKIERFSDMPINCQDEDPAYYRNIKRLFIRGPKEVL